MPCDSLSIPADDRMYLPSEDSSTDDAAESAIIYSNSDKCSSLNKIHARMMVQKLQQLLANSIYGFTNPSYHMGNSLIKDYQDEILVYSHCYEYEYQVNKRRLKSLEQFWKSLGASNLKKPFSTSIEVNTNETT